MEYNEILTKRRSIYDLDRNLPVALDIVAGIIGDCVEFTPSAYNSQSQRVMLVLEENHRMLWEKTKVSLTNNQPEDRIARISSRIDGFIKAYGTILFFDDTAVTGELIHKYPASERNFLTWAEQQNGMLQVNVWNGLAAMGIGANLQHYNDPVEKIAKSELALPDSWRLVAQMPFGGIVARPEHKSKVPLAQRFVIK